MSAEKYLQLFETMLTMFYLFYSELENYPEVVQHTPKTFSHNMSILF